MVPRSKKIIWPKEIKGKARKLRKRGFSYSKISRDLGVAKSTLHPWISDIKRPGYITEADKRAHLNRIRILAARAHREHRLEKIEKIRQKVIKEVAKYSVYNTYYLKSLLAMLYWAEGTKGRGTLAFANTDPKLSLLFLTLLRKSYLIDEEKLRIRLHVHSYHPIKETRKFWSRLLGIPESKFGKYT